MRPLDALGLRPATAALRDGRREPDAAGTDPWAAQVDALVGTAADALGTGDPASAARLPESADRSPTGIRRGAPECVAVGFVPSSR